MGDNKEYLTHPEENGSINISEEVVAAIAAGAACEVDGVSGMLSGGGNVSDLMKKNPARGVKLDCTDDAIALDLYLTVQYGHPIPEVAQNVQKAVSSTVAATTGFTVSAVNVHVGGISIA